MKNIIMMKRIEDIRQQIAQKYINNDFVIDKTGVKTVELIGETFLVDEPSIFGKPNQDYIDREIAWYNSKSLNVNHIAEPIPQIWKDVSGKNGEINSNYGWCIFSEENGDQFQSVLKTLKSDQNSRRAIMIYTRPSMQTEYCTNGMSDFICTNAVQYFIRDEVLIGLVQMRSNDAWAGFRNDVAWQQYVIKLLAAQLQLTETSLIWHVGSLHVYERNFYLIDYFIKTGKIHIDKKDYIELYDG